MAEDKVEIHWDRTSLEDVTFNLTDPDRLEWAAKLVELYVALLKYRDDASDVRSAQNLELKRQETAVNAIVTTLRTGQVTRESKVGELFEPPAMVALRYADIDSASPILIGRRPLTDRDLQRPLADVVQFVQKPDERAAAPLSLVPDLQVPTSEEIAQLVGEQKTGVASPPAEEEIPQVVFGPGKSLRFADLEPVVDDGVLPPPPEEPPPVKPKKKRRTKAEMIAARAAAAQAPASLSPPAEAPGPGPGAVVPSPLAEPAPPGSILEGYGEALDRIQSATSRAMTNLARPHGLDTAFLPPGGPGAVLEGPVPPVTTRPQRPEAATGPLATEQRIGDKARGIFRRVIGELTNR